MKETRREFIKKSGTSVIASTVAAGLLSSVSPTEAAASPAPQQQPRQSTPYDWKPQSTNQPIGVARGIFPGRVAWAHAPGAAHWNGEWKSMKSPWWLDENTNQEQVTAMVADVIAKVSGQTDPKLAWKEIFKYHNAAKGKKTTEYQNDEIVAIKVNMNSTDQVDRNNNYSDVAPQTIYAVVEQLVKYANVPEDKILIYDAKRPVYSAVVQKIWKDFKDVRFVQEKELGNSQKHPVYGDFSRIERPNWTKVLTYSGKGNYDQARNMPKQVADATYLINLAVLKCHSYPYSNMEGGDEGQTAITMTGKNHFGSIQGPWELHGILNTNQEAKPNAYSPIVDMAASPHLGAKTILYMLDGLYSARKHSSYPMHFPNAPFFNKNNPYANTEWPSSVLASLDGVALDSVGLDILYSQTKNNIDPENKNRPWMLIRENADDYLHELALADNPPSGTKYAQDGQPLKSQGVHEHWDDDETRRYSRNIDPEKGMGIELVYTKLG